MIGHDNKLFGFTKESERGSFSPMSSELKKTKENDMVIGDPITQNFGGSKFSQIGGKEYSDMSGWDTFWMSTFKPKKYKGIRLDEARADVDEKYPLEGSCSVLENRLSNMQDEISENVYREGGKGARRVSERQIQALKERREEVKEEKEKECYVDPEVQMQMQMAYQQEMDAKTRKKNIMAFSITGVLLVGAGVLAYFMFFRKGTKKTKGKKKK